ncbi:hypothetical protein AQUCO_04000109v1 [Aquilegia coerulea]|uniref:Uncharacterized protein n=1 Tax=Aquilegia coerulea TaxID=218851 RepID=A0A2G5CR74_AQUCA|nr:hypothetical protein AQUCO_04000109v1 [Aquilegia coerulea]
MMRGEDQQSRLFYELCALVLTILKSPNYFPFSSSSSSSLATTTTTTTTTTVSSSSSSSSTRRRTNSTAQVSPPAFASLLLGISLALMLCGSVTFVIGFILMPWVLGLVMVLYFVGIVSNLSLLGKAILCPRASSPPPPPPPRARSPKEMSELKFCELACC